MLVQFHVVMGDRRIESWFETLIGQPILWGVITLILAAAAFSGRLSMTAANVCLVVAWFTGTFGIYRGLAKLDWATVPSFLSKLFLAFIWAFVLYAFSLWLVVQPSPAVTVSRPTAAEIAEEVAKKLSSTPKAERPQSAITDREVQRRKDVLKSLHQEYILSHDNLSPGMIAGTEPPPQDWLVRRLREMGETWKPKAEQSQQQPSKAQPTATESPSILSVSEKDAKQIASHIVRTYLSSHKNSTREELEQWVNKELGRLGYSFGVELKTPPKSRAIVIENSEDIKIERVIIKGFDEGIVIIKSKKVDVKETIIVPPKEPQ